MVGRNEGSGGVVGCSEAEAPRHSDRMKDNLPALSPKLLPAGRSCEASSEAGRRRQVLWTLENRTMNGASQRMIHSAVQPVQ